MPHATLSAGSSGGSPGGGGSIKWMIRERCVAVRSALSAAAADTAEAGAPRATGAPEEAADVVGGVGGHASLSKVRASKAGTLRPGEGEGEGGR